MRNLAIMLCVAVLVTGLALIAEAQQRPGHGGGMKPQPPGMPLPPGPLSEEVIKEFDKDGDGKLSPEEMKTAREELHKRMLKEFDKDGDGKLSEEEKRAMHESMRSKFIEQTFKEVDTDSNGQVSLDELKAALKKMEEAKKGEPGDAGKQPKPSPPVGDPEAEGARKPVPPSGEKGEEVSPQAPPARPDPGWFFPPLPRGELVKGLVQGFEDFDKDKSGGLSLEEVKAAVAEIMRRFEKQGQDRPMPPAPGGESEEGKKQPEPPPAPVPPPGHGRPGHGR